MTTKPDFQLVRELRSIYHPAKRGIVNAEEVKQIQEVLQIKQRQNIELQNIRDMTVMLYSQWADNARTEKRIDEAMQVMDAMSAIVCVIDQEKFNRGMEV